MKVNFIFVFEPTNSPISYLFCLIEIAGLCLRHKLHRQAPYSHDLTEMFGKNVQIFRK